MAGRAGRLSWGCAAEAMALAMEDGPADIAVIGAGVMGLTTALRLVETGARVTIYANEFPAETRSARATGTWSPSSRIGLADAVAPGFDTRWERWARESYGVHQHYVGSLGDPVEFVQQYALSDAESAPNPSANHDYLHLGRRVSDMTPPWSRVEPQALGLMRRADRAGSP